MTYCSVVTVPALLGLTKKCFDHFAVLKNLSLRSPSTGCPQKELTSLKWHDLAREQGKSANYSLLESLNLEIDTKFVKNN